MRHGSSQDHIRLSTFKIMRPAMVLLVRDLRSIGDALRLVVQIQERQKWHAEQRGKGGYDDQWDEPMVNQVIIHIASTYIRGTNGEVFDGRKNSESEALGTCRAEIRNERCQCDHRDGANKTTLEIEQARTVGSGEKQVGKRR